MYLGEFLIDALIPQRVKKVTPVIVPAVALTPTIPIFPNIDNSVYWAQKAAENQGSTSNAIAPTKDALPAGIKAVDYSQPAPTKIDTTKAILYTVGALGIIMLLSRKGH